MRGSIDRRALFSLTFRGSANAPLYDTVSQTLCLGGVT
ncbi:hypothetical protein BC777_1062 [Yoonia maricola]|uniref:Uncharacterized protein n=1 Tax=Yoonia maricola TaxID=420999 RepID=A0A2M8WMQ2_9RHOB|nr:hypothetical protein BC777_1062 [Yoonia maricola]